MKSGYCILLTLLLSGCAQPRNEHTIPAPPDIPYTDLKYAEGFTVTVVENSKLVEVLYPFQAATTGHKYLLVPRGESVPAHDASTRVIRIPLESIVCTSTTHIPLLDYLGETDKLVGFPTPDYISSDKMRKRIDDGHVTDLGVDKGLNLERLAVLDPGMVMGYTMSSDYGQFKKIEDLEIPVVLNSEYLEKHPLGRAEWIKFMALFFNKEKLADSVFAAIEMNYLGAKALADSAETKPTVLSGILYGDAWFMPGGKNYAARLFEDAGCRYLWADDGSNGYLQVSFESVYNKASEADLWIGVSGYRSLEEIKNSDRRYSKFKAFEQGKVYTYDARKGARGGSEYLELGYLRPDIILQDLVSIAHPALMPGYELYFYEKLD